MSSRELVYYVAVSLDHYIAQADGSVGGFLEEGKHIYDYLKSLRDYDTVLMGKNTYEFGYQYGLEPGQPAPIYGPMMNYVFSQSMEQYQHEQLEVIRENPSDFVQNLKQQEGGSIYLCGGGQLAGTLLDAHLIDRLILKINPIIFGAGIPLFGASTQAVTLHMEDTTVYSNGVIFANYQIEHVAST